MACNLGYQFAPAALDCIRQAGAPVTIAGCDLTERRLGDQLAGVTFECDEPASAGGKLRSRVITARDAMSE